MLQLPWVALSPFHLSQYLGPGSRVVIPKRPLLLLLLLLLLLPLERLHPSCSHRFLLRANPQLQHHLFLLQLMAGKPMHYLFFAAAA